MWDLELPDPALGFAALWFSKLSNVLRAPNHKQAKALFGSALLVPVLMLLQRQIHCKNMFEASLVQITEL